MSVKFSVEFLKRGVCITYGTELQFMQYADIASVVHYTSFGVRELKINHKFYSRQNFYLRGIEHDVCLDLMSKFQSNMREFYSNTSSHQ